MNDPSVCVVVVNFRGAADTVRCLRALDGVDYDPLHIVVVDNASGGDDLTVLRSAAKDIRTPTTIVASDNNRGFAGGCNVGARHTDAAVVAFLNNDAVPDANWLTAATAALRQEPTVAAVASKVLSEDGGTVDFVDAGLTWFGMGYKRDAGKPLADVPKQDHEKPKDVLFATGSAMVVRAAVFEEFGGFDDRFFMFYEDVDLGWRLNLAGWRVKYVPESIVYHKHHGTMATVDTAESGRETFLLERNALAAMYKNLSDETLNKALPAAMALSIRRATARGDIDPRLLDLEAGVTPPHTDPVPIERTSLAAVLAIDQFVDLLPSLKKSREHIQKTRTRSDADLLPLLRNALEPAYPLERYLQAHEILVDAFGIADTLQTRRKVLVITGDAITTRMAGPAIRAWNIAETLSAEHDVRLISVNPNCDPPPAHFDVRAVGRLMLGVEIAWADIVVLQGHILEMAPKLKESNKIVVCDVYDPMHLETLEQGKQASDQRRRQDLAGITKVLDDQLERGDFFLCASERQRHFWLGHLAAIGRLSPRLYDDDPTTASLLAVAPFGLPAAPPERTGPGLRASLGIADGDHVIIWAGGVYSWFDPLTLIAAVDRLRRRRADVRLVFLGMRHPNPEVSEMDIGQRTIAASDELGLTGKHVFFNDAWVPYDERQNWLLDADCGVTTHFAHIETTFAFRTRVLDYLWAGLPIVTTDGDSFADLVATEKLGVVVDPEDPDALADALEKALYDNEFAAGCAERIRDVAQRYTWDQALQPLIEFCRNPRPAADRLPGEATLTTEHKLTVGQRAARDVELAKQYLAAGGVKELANRAKGRISRMWTDRRAKA